MTKDDIIKMARETGMELYGLGRDRTNFQFILQRFAALVAAAEQAKKPAITFDELAQKLVYLGLVQEDAIDDPEGYDDGASMQAIEMLHKFITTGEES
jgi:protein-tyrosine-phosphatase